MPKKCEKCYHGVRVYACPCDCHLKLRTDQQNRALHVYFELLAEELNDAGLDMRKVLKPSIDIPWTKSSVKEYLWRPIQYATTQKKSTTKLLKQKDIDIIYETLNRHLSQIFGISVPFPSVENDINNIKE